jgi:hypothetical protein
VFAGRTTIARVPADRTRRSAGKTQPIRPVLLAYMGHPPIQSSDIVLTTSCIQDDITLNTSCVQDENNIKQVRKQLVSTDSDSDSDTDTDTEPPIVPQEGLYCTPTNLKHGGKSTPRRQGKALTT